ncbi:MAG: RsmD family RNA methyltransferase [Bacteroidota bacterium]
MRIISGTLGRRKLHPPETLPVRPTTDLAKESLFNILNNLIDFEDIAMLDLFAGTGSIAFEFVSRGAAQVTAVDSNLRCIDFIAKTALEFKVTNLKTSQTDVFKFINHTLQRFDVIFADPPYDMPNIPTLPNRIFEKELLLPDGLLVMEHSREHDFSAHPHFSQHRSYGKVNFSFFEASEMKG